MTCGICVPRRELDMSLGTFSGDCLRPETHRDGVHLFQNPAGTYFTWEDDNDCGCCAPEEHDRCFNYQDIPYKQALLLMENQEP